MEWRIQPRATAILLVMAACDPDGRAASAAEEFDRDIEPILSDYCYDCHGDGASKGEVVLDEYDDLATHLENHELWLRTWRNVRSQLMPPARKLQPVREERELLLRWIESRVFKLDPDNPDPGRVTIRRMNREEYGNTVYDLLGVEFATNDRFPPDDTGYGFDTIGDVLSVSPLLLEKYVEAAEEIASRALPPGAAGPPDHVNKRILFDGPVPDGEEARRTYAKRIIRKLAERAFRRPADAQTIDRLTALVVGQDLPEGQTFADGLRLALAVMLSSPRFLFRAEIQPEPDNPARIVPVDEFALASRLSYLLWSSMPDETLFTLAKEGRLREQLDAQVDRMLADEKARRFVRNFTGQWLQARDVESVQINARSVLEVHSSREAERIFNAGLRRDLRRETEHLFAHVLRNNLPASELLTADYGFLNERLARFYGVPNVSGEEFRKVPLAPETHRGGILSQGTFLIVTSNPTRTSPVKRGLFVLENMLGTPPPPPPADVPPLEDAARGAGQPLTMREMMVRHREDPLCKSCHARMDPIGLALENYNAIGLWRDEEGGKVIDTAGALVTGEKFSGADELRELLATARRADFHRCLTEKLLTYAIGRGVEYFDAPTIDAIVARADAANGSLQAIVRGIVHSAPFQKRRGEGNPLTR